MNPSLHPWSPTFLVPCATSVPTLLQVGPHLTMKEQWRECILQPHPQLRIATSHTSKLKSCLFFIFKGHMPYAIYNIYFDMSTFPTSFPSFLCYSCGPIQSPPNPRAFGLIFRGLSKSSRGNTWEFFSLVSVDYQTMFQTTRKCMFQ